jgi:hypothetical protein
MIAAPCDLDAAHPSSASSGTNRAESEQPGPTRLISPASDDGRDDAALFPKAIHIHRQPDRPKGRQGTDRGDNGPVHADILEGQRAGVRESHPACGADGKRGRPSLFLIRRMGERIHAVQELGTSAATVRNKVKEYEKRWRFNKEACKLL